MVTTRWNAFAVTTVAVPETPVVIEFGVNVSV